jgi:Tol biopolymer transport system component
MDKLRSRRLPRRFVVPSAFVLAALLGTAAFAKNWSQWSAPDFQSGINTSQWAEGCASFSPDGLEIYYSTNNPLPGYQGFFDIAKASRPDKDSPFGNLENLGPAVNGPGAEGCPTLRPGGRLYFVSTRVPGDAGEIYMIRRDPQGGWRDLERLPAPINSPGLDESPSFYEDSEGREVMVFSSNRSGRHQIYQSVDGGAPTLVTMGPFSQSGNNMRPTVSKDGLEIYWDSTRGNGGGHDLYVARRSSTSEPFGSAELLPFSDPTLPGLFNLPGFDVRPSISWDRDELVFASRRNGLPNNDLYVVRRSQVTGRNQ